MFKILRLHVAELVEFLSLFVEVIRCVPQVIQTVFIEQGAVGPDKSKRVFVYKRFSGDLRAHGLQFDAKGA
ncbi:hypothetical protein MBAV_002160 [Candidatus Magnetobacterium bavaricum]|uniref:Uncharacterized protein n=1 Tax=Candidatus Magnetobacterium bavaricum TaxID=29290 RepID=A0A0F3GUI9_9BACT|nr:hypothetical protein MBAV_002160 [Candidatus Magnetobacterium bavaricum]